MMANRGCWQDGQASVSWLTGTHVGVGWVAKGERSASITDKDKEDWEEQTLNTEKILNLAADKIDTMFWFGILEDMDRSLELLQHQLQLDTKVSYLISRFYSRTFYRNNENFEKLKKSFTKYLINEILMIINKF